MSSLTDYYRAIRRYDMDEVSPREAADLAWTNWYEQSDDHWEEDEDDGHASEPLTLPVDEVLNQDPRVLFGNERLLLSDVYTDDPFCTGRRDPRRLLMS
jgi:hypothetical protein